MVEQFLDYMRYERNKSPLTVQAYGRDLKDFESYLNELDDHFTFEQVDSDVIRGWIERFMDKGSCSTSINRRLSALRSFYRFALMRGLVSHDPAHAVRGPKNKRPLPYFLRENEADELIDSECDAEDFKQVRTRTIIMMFYETGVRVSELVALNDSSVDMINKVIRVTGKGNKQRIVPFGDELAKAVTDYKDVRDESVDRQSDALFVTTKGTRMNTDQVRYVVKNNLAMVTTMKKKSPHVLRHTFATAMLNHGAGIESIKLLLGHESVDTTEIYTHTTFEQLRDTYNNAHPRA